MLTISQIENGYSLVFGDALEPSDADKVFWQAQSANGSVSSADFPQKLAAYILANPVNSFLELKATKYLYYRPVEDVLRPVANWETEIIERVQYNTDILTARYGAEQRQRLLHFPRVTLEYATLLTKLHLQHFQNQLHIIQGRPTYIPLWQEELVTPDSLFGEWELNDIQGLQAGKYILYSNYLNVEVVEISKTGQDFFFIANPQTSQLSRPRLIPIRLGRINGSQSLSFISSTVARGRIQAELEAYHPNRNTIDLDKKYPVYLLDPNWVTAVQHDIKRETHLLDYNTGKQTLYDLRGYSDTKQTVEFLGRRSKYGIRDFFMDCAGRFAHFYFPTFLEDFVLPENFEYQLNSGIIESKNIGVSQYRAMSSQLIYVEFRNRPAVVCKLKSATDEDTQERFVITNPLNVTEDPFGFTWSANEIKRISYLHKCRFDSDTLEVSWLNREHYRVRTTITTVQ